MTIAKRATTATLAALSILALTSCSSPSTYPSSAELRAAYLNAGGECTNQQPVPAILIGEGADAVMCADDGITMLIVFEGPELTENYVEGYTGTSNVQYGENWVVASDSDVDLGELGGSSR